MLLRFVFPFTRIKAVCASLLQEQKKFSTYCYLDIMVGFLQDDWQKEKRDFLQGLSRISTLPRSNTGEATGAITYPGQIVSVASTHQSLNGPSSMEIVPHANKSIEEKKSSVYAEVVRSLNSARERALSFKVRLALKSA